MSGAENGVERSESRMSVNGRSHKTMERERSEGGGSRSGNRAESGGSRNVVSVEENLFCRSRSAHML